MKKFTLIFATLFVGITMFAVNITDGTKLYLKPNNNWKVDGARFAAYFFGGDGELWVSMTDSNNDGIYEVTCQGTRTNVIFCRMNGGNSTNGWNNKWNQTADLTWDGTKSQYNVPEGAWDGSNNEYWVEVGNNTEVEIPTTWTIAGNIPCLGAEWATDKTENDLVEGENGVWTKTYTNIELTAGTYEYKITKNHMWGESYPSENAKLEIAETSKYDLTFSFNPAKPEPTCIATKVANGDNPDGNDNPNSPDQPKDTKYYVAGTKNLCNSEWNEKDSNNELQLVDNIYTKTYSNLVAGDFQFKITNGTWNYSCGFDNVDASTSTPGYTNKENGNICFTLTSSTSITISFNATTEKITLKADGIDKFGDAPNTEVEITSYTICGDFPCFNGDWAPTNAANDMLKGENGIWTKKYENVTLEAKTYQYKVAANNNWGNNGEFPTNGANQEYIINEAGTYNLTFSYNPTTPELKCEVTKTGDNPGGNPGGTDNPEKPQPEADVYTLCGDPTIFGTEWSETDTNNDMTKGSDGIWVKEYKNITLAKGTYEYKVVASHNWETPGKYPSDNTNMTLYISKDGIYDLKFTFDPTIPELKATATIKVNVENVTINNIYASDGYVHADTNITIYTITGQDVTSQNGNLSQGIYIIKTQNATSKLIIK